ncbi:hypothetical protein GWI33_014141 [Rhynchophorus ferrugineus]|uniref:Uncharacterized protein n=1 Tax=Rhynchophorus ferrugineus TaxID=354439 RepID=A0A834I5P0_RHYFE|nr:hypothetical protein GWI33_014141 [Rhynchophorus ferrugineus]
MKIIGVVYGQPDSHAIIQLEQHRPNLIQPRHLKSDTDEINDATTVTERQVTMTDPPARLISSEQDRDGEKILARTPENAENGTAVAIERSDGGAPGPWSPPAAVSIAPSAKSRENTAGRVGHDYRRVRERAAKCLRKRYGVPLNIGTRRTELHDETEKLVSNHLQYLIP